MIRRFTFLGAPQWKYPLVFLLKIFVFAAFYWVTFLSSPDYFRFSTGYNVTPLSKFWPTFYDTDDVSDMVAGDINGDISALQMEAFELQNAFSFWQDRQAEQVELQRGYDGVLARIEISATEAMEKYEQANIQPLNERIAEIEKIVASISPGSEERISLSGELIGLHEEVVDHLNFLIRDRRGLIPTDLLGEEEILRNKLELGVQATQTSEARYRELRGHLGEAFHKTRVAILSKIGFWDFLYFSTCISTTTTFGDITANKGWLRLVVSLQIVVGIIILARMLGAVARPVPLS